MKNNIIENEPEQNILAKERLAQLLNILSVAWLVKVLFDPFIEFNNELSAVQKGRHVEKSLFRICSIALSVIAGIILFSHHQTTNQFFQKIIAALNMSPTSTFTIASIVSVLYFAHLGSYLSQIAFKIICNLAFKDPDFYITKKQLKILKQKFQAQGYRQIQDTDILQVVDFCRINLRKQSPTKLLGDKPNDWKKTLEAIIYDADLEHFLDQQQALKRKTLQLKNLQSTFLKYYENEQAKQSIKPTDPYTPLTPSISKDRYEEPLSAYIDTTTKATYTCDNRQYSISSSGKRSTSSSSSNSDKLAKYELDKFRRNSLSRSEMPPSEELLISNYKCYLRQRSLITNIALCPEHVMDDITTNTSFEPIYGTFITPKFLSLPSKDSTTEENITPNSSNGKMASVTIGHTEIILTLPPSPNVHCKPTI